MAGASSPDPSLKRRSSGFATMMRNVYRPLGFHKGYNFPLFVIFAGALLIFSLARASYLNIAGSSSSSFKNNASPGEWYNYHKGHMRVGLTLHLVGCLPASFLAFWQFVPVIRHKALLFHRINGYVVIILIFISNTGALIIARRAFGGGLDIQSAVGALALLTTVSVSMAYYNIKRLQIDQHRAWMLRTWFYLGTIITTRLIMICSAKIITAIGSYQMVKPCGEIAFLHNDGNDIYSVDSLPPLVASQYPACATGTASTQVMVQASMRGELENIGAALGLSFGIGLWLSILIHALGIELYLRLTPAEAERLRARSYERQLEAGMKNPGSSGLTSDRWGDAPDWKPRTALVRSDLGTK